MARKIEPRSRQQETSAPNPGADDLQVLNPDVTMELAGRQITIREYRFIDGLAIRAKTRDFVKQLQEQFRTGEVLVEDVIDTLADNMPLLRELVLDATEGADADWYDGLSEVDGEDLLMAWWSVCGPFFVRQVTRRLTQQMVLDAQMIQPRDGQTSTPSSSAPDTEPSSSSESASPSDS